MRQIVFVHGMFQNPKSWEQWIGFFTRRGYQCTAPAWPLHEGEPSKLRAAPPEGLGDLRLKQVIDTVRSSITGNPIMIGHSVGGLITQIMLNEGQLSAGVAISSVAPNAMIDLDWGFIKNSAVIANPLKGNEPVYMDAETFHSSFANALSEAEAADAFQRTATHDSRNVFRDCMGEDGRVDLEKPHNPLLMIGGEEDEIVPADLVRKNAAAYDQSAGVVSHREYSGRSHFICGEHGWEEVASHVYDWLDHLPR